MRIRLSLGHIYVITDLFGFNTLFINGLKNDAQYWIIDVSAQSFNVKNEFADIFKRSSIVSLNFLHEFLWYFYDAGHIGPW